METLIKKMSQKLHKSFSSNEFESLYSQNYTFLFCNFLQPVSCHIRKLNERKLERVKDSQSCPNGNAAIMPEKIKINRHSKQIKK